MNRRRGRWEELQSRWARGERLSEDEERERLAYAALDPMAHRELELFTELRERGESDGPPVSPALVESVLDAAQGRPRLRLVTPTEREPMGSFDELRSIRPRALVMAAALLAAAAVAAAVLVAVPSAAPAPAASAWPTRNVFPAQVARAVLVLAAGDVTLDERRAAVNHDRLREGQRLATGDGSACLTIDSAMDVCLASNSVVQLQSLAAPSIRLRVESGTALASLARRPAGSSFSLIVDGVSANAHGTVFAARRAQGHSEVIVLDGSVDVVRANARRERVDAHSRAIVRSSPGALERAPVERSEEARLLALRSWHELWTGGSVGALYALAGQPAALQASIDDQPPLPLPLQVLVRAGKRRLTWRDAAGALTSSWIDVAVGKMQRIEAPLPTPAVHAREPADKPSAATLLESARREVARARPAEALSLYEKLRATYPDSAEAHTVLVTMGKLELNLGRQERALRHFDTYLRRNGALAPEALAGKIRALRALGRQAEERDAVRQYLARYPRGLEAPLLEKRLRELGPP